MCVGDALTVAQHVVVCDYIWRWHHVADRSRSRLLRVRRSYATLRRWCSIRLHDSEVWQ